ncbi:hypothetical protein CYMTET_5265, partial [Cymbomonas tetramitiformis]
VHAVGSLREGHLLLAGETHSSKLLAAQFDGSNPGRSGGVPETLLREQPAEGGGEAKAEPGAGALSHGDAIVVCLQANTLVDVQANQGSFSGYRLSGSRQVSALTLAALGQEVWVGGTTNSRDLRVQAPEGQEPLQAAMQGASDGYIAKLAVGDGCRLGPMLLSTYLGGSGQDSVDALVPGNDGGLWVLGTTTSKDLLVTNTSKQARHGGGLRDLFVGRII